MTLPIFNEALITLATAARRFPARRGTGQLHPRTLARWILRGCVAPNGERVRLEGVRAGSSWFTSEQAIARFLAALTELSGPAQVPHSARSPVCRSRSSTAAENELRRLGA